MCGTWIRSKIQKGRETRQMIVIVVAFAVTLDSTILTVIIPIMPSLLFDMDHPNASSTATSGPLTLPNSQDNVTLEVEEATQEETAIFRAEVYANKVGILIAANAFSQLLANPVVGSISSRIGYSIPMSVGFVIMYFSTLLFAVGSSYGVLLLARIVQGLGFACTCVGGFSMVADKFPDNAERGRAMSIATAGLALGTLIGPPFGAFTYQFIGKSAPFYILTGFIFVNGALQCIFLQPSVKKKGNVVPPTLKSLLKDPYILIATGATLFTKLGYVLCETALPSWMLETMAAKQWETGAIFIPAGIAQLVAANYFGTFAHRIGRWRGALIALICGAVCLILVPFSQTVIEVIFPFAGVGVSMILSDNSIIPELAHIADVRHTSVYGNVYAIGEIATGLAFFIGPAMTGPLINSIGFQGMLIVAAILMFLYAPLLFFLKNIPEKSEKVSLISSTLSGGYKLLRSEG